MMPKLCSASAKAPASTPGDKKNTIIRAHINSGTARETHNLGVLCNKILRP